MEVRKLILTALDVMFVIMILFLASGLLICTISEARADEKDYLSSCAPYENKVKQILKSEGVSEDYYYLMVSESHCRKGAISDKGAVGFWQMIPRTMKKYGCNNADDIECQTLAAARYLSDLSQRYHNVDDVISAWNMGGHNYAKIRRRTWEASGLVSKFHRIKDLADSLNGSTLVLDNHGNCIYWYWNDSKDKLNPCSQIPENSELVWSK